jgi:hypothetical protein
LERQLGSEEGDTQVLYADAVGTAMPSKSKILTAFGVNTSSWDEADIA